MLLEGDSSGSDGGSGHSRSPVNGAFNRLSAVERLSLSDADTIRELVEDIVVERGKLWNDYLPEGALPKDVVEARKSIVVDVIRVVSAEKHDMLGRVARIKELINAALDRLAEQKRLETESRAGVRGILGGFDQDGFGFHNLDDSTR